MKELLADVLVLVVVTVVPYFLAKAFAWWKARADKAEDVAYHSAIEALEVGVQEAWELLGKSYKKARSDGKFTVEEKQALREHAITVARQVGEEQGLDVLKIIGKRIVPLILRKIVEARKKDN